MYLHGGAFVKGSLDSGDSNAWGIAAETGALVVSVDYRLAPENPYPAPLQDALSTLDHLAENAAAFDIDPMRIALWGDSAGAAAGARAVDAGADRADAAMKNDAREGMDRVWPELDIDVECCAAPDQSGVVHLGGEVGVVGFRDGEIEEAACDARFDVGEKGLDLSRGAGFEDQAGEQRQ